MTLSEAHHSVQEYAEQHGAAWFDDTVIDRGSYWFFRVGFIGSCGVIVDKADGRLSVMGSALSLEDCFWGHEHGFSPELVLLHVTKVHDVSSTVEFLLHHLTNGPPPVRNPNVKRAWFMERLQALPYDFGPQALWLRIPAFRELGQHGWFEYEVLVPSS